MHIPERWLEMKLEKELNTNVHDIINAELRRRKEKGPKPATRGGPTVMLPLVKVLRQYSNLTEDQVEQLPQSEIAATVWKAYVKYAKEKPAPIVTEVPVKVNFKFSLEDQESIIPPLPFFDFSIFCAATCQAVQQQSSSQASQTAEHVPACCLPIRAILQDDYTEVHDE